MTANQKDFDSTRLLVTSDGESNSDLEEPLASTRNGSVKWRMLTLMLGLAMGTAIIVYSRQGTSLTTLRKFDHGTTTLTKFDTDGMTMLNENITEVDLDVVIRDFKESHPDMERDDKGFHPDLVESTIGPDNKPVYKGGITVQSKASFDQWYRDTPGVNFRVDKKIKLIKNSAGQFVFDKTDYFPIDGEGFKDSTLGHNYFFTLELHHIFKYHGDEVFTFRGDDDLWVFINGQKVIDLGGTHEAMERTVTLRNLDLTKGSVYPLDLFFAERHTVDSNFRIETTLHLEEKIDPNPVGPDDQCCLIKPLKFVCFNEKQWWTFWC